MADLLADIARIVKARFETAAYAGTYFRMAPDVLDLLRAREIKSPEPEWRRCITSGLERLLSIPIVEDHDLPDGTWQLQGFHNGGIIHEQGVIPSEVLGDERGSVDAAP